MQEQTNKQTTQTNKIRQAGMQALQTRQVNQIVRIAVIIMRANQLQRKIYRDIKTIKLTINKL